MVTEGIRLAGEPFVLAMASHKGGTGRTTAACALAWLWGRDGLHVVLADADPAGIAGLIALDAAGDCPWANVRYFNLAADATPSWPDADVVIVDCPSLMDAGGSGVLQHCHGVVLTSLADPLSLRTVPSAARVLATARVTNPELELLGVLIGQFDESDFIQVSMLERLRAMHGELLLEPPVPADGVLRDWALTPGAALPAGRGALALEAARDRIADLVWRLHKIELAVNRLAGSA